MGADMETCMDGIPETIKMAYPPGLREECNGGMWRGYLV